MIITNSSSSTFQLCERRYYFEYHRGFSSRKKNSKMMIGTIYHKGMAVFLETGSIDQGVSACGPANWPEDCQKEALTAGFMLLRFSEYLTTHPLPGKPIELELAIKVKIAYGLWTAGVVDGIIADGQDYWVLEHKTTASLDWEYLEKVGLDGQITFYLLLAEAYLNRMPNGVIYNVASRPRTYRRKDENISTYLARCKGAYQSNPVSYFAIQRAFRSERLLAEKRAEIRRIAYRIRGAARSGIWVKSDAVCFMRGRKCPYTNLCLEGETPHSLSEFRIREPHSELSENSTRMVVINKLKGGQNVK